MSETVIDIENLYKQYRLGIVGTGTLREDFNRWWHKIRGKEDPYLKIGEVNDRSAKSKGLYVWALQDVSFKVKHGEVLGIVGRNGAGKSTLLKILSKVTQPTKGQIKVKGRIASLLEVGTGFHPELTGRENIFLNGAILGMTKREIRRKFDEIVDFTGVERYIDTPVKRYSSGMYVRLAFGVAAHLEPEILIVDEVLAVGDAEFQKKCLGKMSDVSKKEGRTVLFVSHNMSAVKSLCTQAVILEKGKMLDYGITSDIVRKYLDIGSSQESKVYFETEEEAIGNEYVRFKRIEIVPESDDDEKLIFVNTPIKVECEFWNYVEDAPVNLSMCLKTMDGIIIFNTISESKYLTKGLHYACCNIPGHLLNSESYMVSMMAVANTSRPLYNINEAVSFTVEELREGLNWYGKWEGFVRPQLSFTIS